MTRHYFAAVNNYGIKCSYESIGWCSYRFNSKKERDEFVARKNEESNKLEGIAEKVTSREAYKMAGKGYGKGVFVDHDGAMFYK